MHSEAKDVEPKFKVGDWVVSEHSGNTYKIRSIDYSNSNYIRYMCEHLFDNNNDILCFSEEMIHLWTIQDAKNGDVLYTSSTASNEVFIFKRLSKEGNIECYCSYDSEDKYCEGKYHFIGKPDFTTHPATKEKYDILFSKMKEAGYEWDVENKELKKIEKNYTLSKDDDRIFDKLMKYFDLESKYYFNENDYNEAQNWFKSIKERMHMMQPIK